MQKPIDALYKAWYIYVSERHKTNLVKRKRDKQMAMQNWTATKTKRNASARSQELKEQEVAKYSAKISKKAALIAAYKAGYELGKSGLGFSEALWQYQKTLTLNMSSKENEAFVGGHWASEHGQESEF